MPLKVRWFAILPLILWASQAQAQTLMWDPNPEPPTVSGYQVLMGTAPSAYGTPIPVGKVTSFPIPPASPAYLAVQAIGIDGQISQRSVEVVYQPTPAPIPTPVPVPVPIPTPVPVPAPAKTCKDGSAIFTAPFSEWVYTKVSGSFEANADYKRLIAAGWTYVAGSAYRQRANYYNLQFKCA